MLQPLRETSLSDYVNGIYLAILVDTFDDFLNYSLKPTEKLMKNWKKKNDKFVGAYDFHRAEYTDNIFFL